MKPVVPKLWPTRLQTLFPKVEKQKVYIIKLDNKRFNSKKFPSYEEARKYVRRLITKRVGTYIDNIGDLGFSIQTK